MSKELKLWELRVGKEKPKATKYQAILEHLIPFDLFQYSAIVPSNTWQVSFACNPKFNLRIVQHNHLGGITSSAPSFPPATLSPFLLTGTVPDVLKLQR